MKRVDGIKWGFYLAFRILLVAAGAYALYKKDWLNFGLAVITVMLTFVPPLFEKRFKVDYPSEFEIAIIIFLFTSIYLGGIRDYYYKIWWWDVILHTFSGVIIGMIGFSLVSLLNREKELAIHLPPAFVAIFSFSFAIAIGAMWEIFEFAMDSFFGFNMQKSGLVDTMWDLIVDALGALVVCVLGYFYLKKDPQLFERMEKVFLK
ncbi:hypothetical protein ACFL6I_09610 [candidate division KSB1 bacterium]